MKIPVDHKQSAVLEAVSWIARLALCAILLTASTAFAQLTTNYWTGSGSPNNRMDVSGNWSKSAAPAAGQWCVWSNSLATATNYIWNANIGGSGSAGASYEIQGTYTNPIAFFTTNYPSSSGFYMSNIVVDAGAGPFTFGSNGYTCPITFRAVGSNVWVNNSAYVATIASGVTFGDGNGQSRTVYFGGSGGWVMNTPWNSASSVHDTLVVNGSGLHTLTMTADAGSYVGNASIVSGTLVLADGNALATSGAQTLTIGGSGGQITLALTNNITLNSAVSNIYVGGRNTASSVSEAAIYNLGGNNSINGNVVFNATGGGNVNIYNGAGTLTFNGSLYSTLANSARYFGFAGLGTNIVNGVISNGVATSTNGIILGGGTLVLNNANTFTGSATITNSGVLTIGNNLALQSSTVVVSGGTLDMNGGNGFSPYVGGLSGTGVVDTLSGGTPTLSVGSNNVSSVFNGDITNSSGTVSLNKVGTGTFILAGASGYAGGTTVAAGTLLASNTVGSATGSGNTVVNSGAAFGGSGFVSGNVNWQSGSSAQFGVTNVSGVNAATLVVSGSGTMSGNAVTVNVLGSMPLPPGTYTLMTYNTSGSSGAFNTGAPLYIGAGAALGTSSSISTSGGVVTLTVVLTGVSATWTNDVDGNWTAVADWSSNPLYPHSSGDAATLGVGSALRTVTLNAPVSLGTLIFTNANSFSVANAGNALTFASTAGAATVSVQAGSANAIAAPITLNTNLTISMSSGTALSLTNTISGARTLTVNGAGTVVLSGNNTYGPAAGSVGTTLGGGAVLQLGNNNSASTGDLSVSGSSTIQAGAALTLANNIITGSGVTATVDNNGNNVTLSGLVSGGGALVKNSAGTLSLNSANTYTNGITINAGTLKLNNASGIPGGAGYGNVTLSNNATLDLNGNSVVLNGLNSSTNATTVDTLSGGAVTLTLGESGAGGTFVGSIKNTSGGSLSLVKDGAGTQTLAGTNTYAGTTTINAGTLQVGNGGTSGNLGSGTLTDNGVLAFNLIGTNVFSSNINGSGGVVLNNTNLSLWLTGNNGFTGGVTNNGGAFWVTNASQLSGATTVQDTSPNASIHLDGTTGNLALGASTTFVLSGGQGVLINEAGSNTINGNIYMPNGNGNPYVVVNNGFLTLAGTISTVSGNNSRALTLGGAGNGLVSGNIADVGSSASVTKLDGGTWTLSGSANTYSGTTSVGNGTLLVMGVNDGTGAVTVSNSATLGGTGTTYGAVTFLPGAMATFTASTTASTPLTVYNKVALNTNALTVYVDGGTPLSAGTYTLLNEANPIYAISGSFAITPTITGAGLAAGTVASVATVNSNQVVLTVVNNSVWVNDANGNWSTPANWLISNVPNDAGQFATFGISSGLRTVNLDGNETVGGLLFTNANSFVITNASNVLTLNNNGNGAQISVTAGATNSIAAGVLLSDNATVTALAGTSFSIPGNVTGSGGLTLTGNGMLTLSGSNAYSGATTVNLGTNSGTLMLGSTNAIGSGTLTITSGFLDSSVPNLVNQNNNAQNWNGSFVFNGSQNLNLGSGAVTLGANSTVNVNSNTLAVGGPISGSFSLTKNGAGTLVLGGASGSGFTGGVTINGGTVILGDDTSLGSGTLTFNSASATIQSIDATPRTLANNVNATYGGIYAGAGNLTFTGSIPSGNQPKTFMISNAVTTFSGSFSDGGAPVGSNTKDGPGTLVLSGSNTNTKSMIVKNGTLALGSTAALGTGSLTMNGGGLDSTVASLVNANNNSQAWGGNFYFAGSQSLNMGTGSVAMNTNTIITVSNNTFTVGGAITGTNRSLTKSGTGTLVLTGANIYGNTTVAAGTLEIAQATLTTNSTVSISNSAVLQLDFGTTNQVAALVLGGTSQSAGVYKSANSGGRITGTGSLLVVPLAPAVNTNAPIMHVSVSGNVMSLGWPTNLGWTLQTNNVGLAATGQWHDYPGSAALTNVNITVNPSLTNVFFRMVYTNTP